MYKAWAYCFDDEHWLQITGGVLVGQFLDMLIVVDDSILLFRATDFLAKKNPRSSR